MGLHQAGDAPRLYTASVTGSLKRDFFSSLLNMDMQAATTFLLFGSTAPYISSGKRKVIEKEFRDEMKKLMK